MTGKQSPVPSQIADKEWVTFPGGELEGERPRALCPACRAALKAGRSPAAARTLCFQCYRADLDRQRALRAAGDLDTASESRFQSQLPFEPVDIGRLKTLKAARAEVRNQHAGSFDNRRRRAQIDARHALQTIAANMRARGLSQDAIHAAELQLPEAWLPYVVAR